MPEIQLVPAAVVNLFAVAQEVPLPGNLVGQGTFDAHHLDFQPDAGHHALFPDVIHHLFQAAGKPAFGRLPFAHVVPPEAVGIPARVHTVVFAPRLRRLVDEGQLLLSGGVRPQAVHVVVENDGQGFVVSVFPADAAAVGGQLAHSLVEASGAGADADGNGGKGFAGLQVFPPVGLVLRGTGKLQVEVAVLVGDLPVPGAVVLNLPVEGGICLLIIEAAHGQILLSGPVACVGDVDVF